MAEYTDDQAVEVSDCESDAQRDYSEPMSASPSSRLNGFADEDRKKQRRLAAKRRSEKMLNNREESSGDDVSDPSSCDDDDSDIVEENDPAFYAGLDNDDEALADAGLHAGSAGSLARQAGRPKSGGFLQSAKDIVDQTRKRKADDSDASFDVEPPSCKRQSLDDAEPVALPSTPIVPSKSKAKARSRAAAKPRPSSKKPEGNVNSQLKLEGETFRCASTTYTVVHAGQPAPVKKSNNRNMFAWDLVNASHFTTAVDNDHNYDVFLQSELLLPARVDNSKASAIEARAPNRESRKLEALASANRVMSQDGKSLLRLVMPSQYYKQLVSAETKTKLKKVPVPTNCSKKLGPEGGKMMALALQSQLNVESLETIEAKYLQVSCNQHLLTNFLRTGCFS